MDDGLDRDAETEFAPARFMSGMRQHQTIFHLTVRSRPAGICTSLCNMSCPSRSSCAHPEIVQEFFKTPAMQSNCPQSTSKRHIHQHAWLYSALRPYKMVASKRGDGGARDVEASHLAASALAGRTTTDIAIRQHNQWGYLPIRTLWSTTWRSAGGVCKQ